MSTALRQQIDRTIELAIASGFGLTITIQLPGVEPATEADDCLGLHPECYRLLTYLSKAVNGMLSLDLYASLTGRTLEETRAAMRGAHRSKEYIVAMDVMYTRFDGERLDGGKMRCYAITEQGRQLLTQRSTTH